MKIELDGRKWNKGHVFIWDGRHLIAKFWFYGDGTVTYREWKPSNSQHIEVTKGEVTIFKPSEFKEDSE